jgi:hypothetical protein
MRLAGIDLQHLSIEWLGLGQMALSMISEGGFKERVWGVHDVHFVGENRYGRISGSQNYPSPARYYSSARFQTDFGSVENW